MYLQCKDKYDLDFEIYPDEPIPDEQDSKFEDTF